MDFDIDDGKNSVFDLNDKTLDEAFEIFKSEIADIDFLDVLVRFHQNGFFVIQKGEVITFWDIRKFSSEEINKLSNVIVDFCIKNDIEVVLI